MTAAQYNEGTDWQDRIVSDPAVLNGEPTIKGTGISAALVGQLLRRGYTVDAITSKYLHITEEDVEACRRYHETEMERSLADMIAKIEKATPEKVADWRDRIECVPGRLGGKPVIVNTRISVELVTDLLEGGRTAPDIVRRYPHIRVEDVDACAKYKATGVPLSKTTWAELDAWMDGAEPKKS